MHDVPLFASLRPEDAEQVASMFKERRFAAGETVTKEGSGGAAFFLIQSGEATVSVRGERKAELKAGDHFGEIALIDGGERSATVTAGTDLVCYGLTYWDFRPLVQQNPAIAWGLLQSLARMLRSELRGDRSEPAAPAARSGNTCLTLQALEIASPTLLLLGVRRGVEQSGSSSGS